MENKEFARLFGGVVRVFVWCSWPLHLISFSVASWFLYAYFMGHLEQFGIQSEGLAFAGVILSTILAASVIEILHKSIPARFFWALFTIRRWYKSPTQWAMFITLGLLGYGVTQVSAFTSQGGAVDLARRQYAPPPPTDISTDLLSASQDSAAAHRLAQAAIEAINLEYDAKVAAAAAPYNAQIASLKAALQGHEQDLRKGNKWAGSWISKRQGEIATVTARRASAIELAQADRGAALAAVKSKEVADIRAISERLGGTKATASMADSAALAIAMATNADLVTMASKGGVNVVWLLVILACIVTFYRVHAGHEFEGAEFAPSGLFGRFTGELSGIFSDKMEHVVDRTSATRQNLQKRNEAKPFAVPSGRVLTLGFALTGIAFFVAQTFVFNAADHQEALMVPFPYNYAGLIFMVVFLAFAVKREAKERKVSTKVSIDSADAGADNSADSNADNSTSRDADKSADQTQPGADRDADKAASKVADKATETGLADSFQRGSAADGSALTIPAAGVARPLTVKGKIADYEEFVKYRKRVYGWWKTANDRKRKEDTRAENLARCNDAFAWMREHGIDVTVQGKKLSIKL